MTSCDDERGPQLYKVDSAGMFFPYKVIFPSLRLLRLRARFIWMPCQVPT